MEYIDFHTHLDWYKDEDNLMEQLRTFKGTIVAASSDADSFQKNQLIAQNAQKSGFAVNIIPTFGIHPQNAAQSPDDLSVYDDFCNASPLIGEIGMDFLWCKDVSPLKQEKVFRYFLEHCNSTGKACVIHTKDAEIQIARILEEYKNLIPVIHWYDGPEDVYQEFCNRHYFQTFGCETCRSSHIQQLLKITPKNLILAETDNPTGEPWLGGTDNSVHLIKRIYQDIADTLEMPVRNVAELIKQNSRFINSK